MNNIKYTNMIKRSDGWFTYYKCTECKHKMFLDKGESLPVKCPNCHRIILKKKRIIKKHCCPVCGGNLNEYQEGSFCDTCTYYIDNEGIEHNE